MTGMTVERRPRRLLAALRGHHAGAGAETAMLTVTYAHGWRLVKLTPLGRATRADGARWSLTHPARPDGPARYFRTRAGAAWAARGWGRRPEKPSTGEL